MTLEEIKIRNIAIVQEKGLGVSPEGIIVPEKIALIHSEISEAYDAYLKNNLDGKHGFYEEMADVLLRVLHLMAIYEMSIPEPKDPVPLPTTIDGQIASLHKIVSESYENYRHNKIDEFKQGLLAIVNWTTSISLVYKFDIRAEADKKMEYNRNREWDKNSMNEKIN